MSSERIDGSCPRFSAESTRSCVLTERALRSVRHCFSFSSCSSTRKACMRILVWHVHGGWMDAFVRGQHQYLVPTTAARDADGLGRGGRDWPDSVVEIAPEDVAAAEVDVVVLQRTEELEAAERLLGGRSVPIVFVEHNALVSTCRTASTRSGTATTC